jgi:hypothetical protein
MTPFVPSEHPFIIVGSAFFGVGLGIVAAILLIRVRPIRAVLDRLSRRLAAWLVKP